MTPYLIAVAVGVLCWAGGYLRGSRQHFAEHEQVEWVSGLTADPVEIEAIVIEGAPAPEPLAIEAAPAVTAAGLPVREPAAEPEPVYEVDDAQMQRLLAWLRDESPLTVELAETDYWAPIAASMGPLPVEPELELVGAA